MADLQKCATLLRRISRHLFILCIIYACSGKTLFQTAQRVGIAARSGALLTPTPFNLLMLRGIQEYDDTSGTKIMSVLRVDEGTIFVSHHGGLPAWTCHAGMTHVTRLHDDKAYRLTCLSNDASVTLVAPTARARNLMVLQLKKFCMQSHLAAKTNRHTHAAEHAADGIFAWACLDIIEALVLLASSMLGWAATRTLAKAEVPGSIWALLPLQKIALAIRIVLSMAVYDLTHDPSFVVFAVIIIYWRLKLINWTQVLLNELEQKDPHDQSQDVLQKV